MTGKPITFYIEPVGAAGVYKIIASIFIDNKQIEKSGTYTFAGTKLALGIQGADVEQLNNISSSFAVHQFKVYKGVLDQETRKQHTKDPGMLSINNNTSSYFDSTQDDYLIYYSPLGANHITESFTTATDTNPYEFINYANSGETSTYAIKV